METEIVSLPSQVQPNNQPKSSAGHLLPPIIRTLREIFFKKIIIILDDNLKKK